MKISNFSESDVGVYTCIASNVMGRANSTIRLYGELPPKSRRQGCRVSGREGAADVSKQAKTAANYCCCGRKLNYKPTGAFSVSPAILTKGGCLSSPDAMRRLDMPQRVSFDFNLIFRYQLLRR